MFFKRMRQRPLTLTRIVEAMELAQEFDPADCHWYDGTLTVRLDKVDIISISHHLYDHDKYIELRICIKDNKDDLVVYSSPTFDIFNKAEHKVCLMVGDDFSTKDGPIRWIHKGTWCDYIEHKIEEIETKAKVKIEEKRKIEELKKLVANKNLEDTKSRLNIQFNKKFT